MYRSNSSHIFQFLKMDVVLDASPLCYLCKTSVLSLVSLSWLQIGFGPLEMLNHSSLKTSYEHNYRNWSFLMRNRYLLVLNISWSERRSMLLLQLRVLKSLIIVCISHFRSVSHTHSTSGYYGWHWREMELFTNRTNVDNNIAAWLHERLTVMSKAYRCS